MQLTRLGPYEINKQLGKGGMGSVYAATDTHTGQRVAIKALSPHLATAEGFRERFEAEIESLKTLKHHGIVRLYGYGEQDGVLFYSMEIVDGISLEDELRAGRRFTWREVTNIAIQLSHALKHAHDHGIVHRDIKPANILLGDDEHVKLADFGIARLFGSTQLTTAGGVLGTADYMSPEQAEGRPVTARCDQYSLGGVMYALLAGRPPFLAKNLPQMLQLQRFANPEPVRRYAPETPEQLERVIDQLLSKDPADRFPNTQVLARHLQAMALALSRPASDDFALRSEQLLDRVEIDPSHANDVTQADPNAESQASAPKKVSPDQRTRAEAQAAVTLATDDPASRDAFGSDVVLAVPPLATPEQRARFTTIEEEQARILAENRRSWIITTLQVAALLALFAAMGGMALYFSRDPSADELYADVTERIDADAPLSSMEQQIDEFLERFPSDSRVSEIKSYRQRIDLERLERKLRRQARDGVNADASLLPVEQLYLRAAKLQEDSPEEAARTLQSLIDLYGDDRNDPKDDTAKAIVKLAAERLETLKQDLESEHAQKLAALTGRLAAAEQLSQTDPAKAAAMYEAIIYLHGSDGWAHEIVTRAQSRLRTLGDNSTKPNDADEISQENEASTP